MKTTTLSCAQQDGLADVVAAFCDFRQQQIVMLDELTQVDWEAPRATLWGDKPLKMIVTKTYLCVSPIRSYR